MALVGSLSGSESVVPVTGVLVAADVVSTNDFPKEGDTGFGTDVSFYVSGAKHDNRVFGESENPATVVFAGDLVTSGASYFGLQNNATAGDYGGVGTDVTFFVSGTKGSRGHGHNQDEGTALFGGDIILSGALHVGFEPTESDDGSVTTSLFHGKNEAGLFKVDGNNDQVSVLAYNQGSAIDIGTDVIFFCSGWSNSRETDHAALALFAGDVVMSGCLRVENQISSSIHMTEDGVSFLAEGANITITSASNGQITIAAASTASPAGSDTQYQYNNGSSMGGTADLTYNDSTGDTTVGAATSDAKLFFRDSGIYIWSETDGDLAIVADDTIEFYHGEGDGERFAFHHGSSEFFAITSSAGMAVLSGGMGKVELHAGEELIADFRATTPGLVMAGEHGVFLRDSGLFLSSSANGKVTLGSDGTSNDALTINSENGGVGISSSFADAQAIQLNAPAGGIDVYAGSSGIDIDTAGIFYVTSSVNNAGAVQILASHANGGVLIRGSGAARFGDDTGDVRFDGSGALSESGITTISFTPSSTVDIDAGGAVTIDSSAAISIGGDDDDQAINIGTNGDRTITIGKSGGSTTLNIHSDGGDLTLDAGSNDITITAGEVLPATDLGVDLGSTSKRFANIYTGDLHLKNDRGDWSVIEENDYLTLTNNKTGKRYKFVMELLDD